MSFKNHFIILFSAFCLLALNGFSQKPFEGIITYNVSISGDGAEAVQAFMPTEFKYYFKNSSVKLVMSGGFSAMLGEYLIDGNKGISYLVKHEEKSYSVLKDESNAKSTENSNFLGETLFIEGYECKKYESVTTNENGEKTTSYLWTTDKISIKFSKKESMNSNMQMLFGSSNKGFPLKVVSENQGFNLTLTATSIDKRKLSKKEFQVPKNYQLKEME